MTRFRIRSNESITGDSLSNALIELPRFDYRRRAGRNYRYLYAVSQPPTGDFFNSLVKLDLDQNTNLTWHEPGCYPGEPVFVSRPGSDKEDDGVILSVVLETSHATSFLLILDASTFTELARASAPHHIPFSFHGEYFVDAK